VADSGGCYLDPSESGTIFWVGELRYDEAGQPCDQQTLVVARHKVRRFPEVVRRCHSTDDEQQREVEMRDKVGDELDKGDAIHTVPERQRKDQPNGRQQQRYEEDAHNAAGAHVCQVPGPDLGEVVQSRIG